MRFRSTDSSVKTQTMGAILSNGAVHIHPLHSIQMMRFDTAVWDRLDAAARPAAPVQSVRIAPQFRRQDDRLSSARKPSYAALHQAELDEAFVPVVTVSANSKHAARTLREMTADVADVRAGRSAVIHIDPDEEEEEVSAAAAAAADDDDDGGLVPVPPAMYLRSLAGGAGEGAVRRQAPITVPDAPPTSTSAAGKGRVIADGAAPLPKPLYISTKELERSPPEIQVGASAVSVSLVQ